ncbi:hypothetical protein EPUL_000465 [Erysiphe pulchra]|uniref:Phosducin domain-containing protein n=1 Tax=Erysiphe pulchra TaxID=225359 RepID=A0A2S4PZV1_9PEZI|nr:hypothetical protein EPUL_000465 [Erysiphe pulchra]
MSDRESHEESVFDTTKPTLDEEDDLIAALEDDDSASFVAFREQRIQQLHNEYYRAKTRLSSGYGSFIEIKEEKNLMDLITSSANIVVHFAKDDFARCNIMDDHLNTLASTHYNTRFVKIRVENSPFLVVKMGVKVLPCVLCWIDGKVVDRIVGFEGLGYTENTFITKDLETRLLTAGVVQKSEYVNLKNGRKIADSSLDEDSDDVIAIARYTEFSAYLKRAYRQQNNDENQCEALSLYAASIYDIKKMLSLKKRVTRKDIIIDLPDELQRHHRTFEADHDDSLDLPPHRPGVDLAIDIDQDEQDRIKDLSKGPLYNMSRDELLCLCKEVTELLDRNWIRASSSPGDAPSDGSRDEHFEKVNKALDRLANAELKFDLKKCNFTVKEVNSLRFKITAGKWETPRTQTGVRNFLGFANVYRDFINNFASLSYLIRIEVLCWKPTAQARLWVLAFRNGTLWANFGRLEQETPIDPTDPKLHYKEMQLIDQKWLALTEQKSQQEIFSENRIETFQEQDLNNPWNESTRIDGEY